MIPLENLRPRILIFSLAYFPFVGGAEVAVRELTKRLPDFEFDIISADLARGFWAKYLFPFTAHREAVRRHLERPYALVWSIMANQAGIAGALFKSSHPEVPLLLTLQEGDDLESFAYRLRLLAPRAFHVFRWADQIQAISNYLAEWARKMGATCPITVIPNGVDLKNFKLKAKSEQLTATPTIITTSRLVHKNGVDDLIKSLAFLSSDVKLQILGDGPEKMALNRLVDDLKLASRVSFLGQVESSKLSGHLGRARIFVRPARSEGLGNSFLEAMAAGLPVIGTPVGGIPDFLHDPSSSSGQAATGLPAQTGWFCRVNDPESIAEKVKYILDPANQSVVQKVIDGAKRLVSENYDWDKLAPRFGTLIRSML